MIRQKFYFLFTIAALAFATGCASPGKLFTDYDPSQDFSGYKTFAWTEERPMKAFGDYPPSALTEQRIMNAIKSTLSGKGYRFVENTENADFAVSFTVGARDEIQYVNNPPVFVPAGRWSYVAYDTGVTTRKYTEGSLAIDVFDAKRRVAVWHGAGEKRLSREEVRSNEGIDSAVAAILSGFPPQ